MWQAGMPVDLYLFIYVLGVLFALIEGMLCGKRGMHADHYLFIFCSDKWWLRAKNYLFNFRSPFRSYWRLGGFCHAHNKL